MSNQIALGADHAGFEEKEVVKRTLDELGLTYTDFGTNSLDSVDYPDFARKVGEAVASGEFEKGLLFCGSGTGMAIAANKVPGVRAAMAWNVETAELSRQHNDANVLTVGTRTTPTGTIPAIVKAWLATGFEGGRHQNRIDKIIQTEKEDLQGLK